MTHTPHELAADFPEHTDAIHALREANPHFAKLCESYHEVNRAIHRAETLVEPTSEAHEQELRRERMTLKDELWRMIRDAA